MPELKIIGAGLAGCEAAWQAAIRGIDVILYEMRPEKQTLVHTTPNLAELVCSNSLGSNLPDRASGLLKSELRRLDSLLLTCARQAAVPAGDALAVDRDVFSHLVTKKITSHPRIHLVNQEVLEIPTQPAILASGPLTSDGLASSIQSFTGQENLAFFDALAPIITHESIDQSVVFRASRRMTEEEGDYLNCPFSREQYYRLVQELLTAEQISLHDFEKPESRPFFEGCLPIEEIARRSPDSLAYGPMRPIGLRKSFTSAHPYAVVQLRQDNLANTLYNLVGFQTNLKFPEQERVFRLIPGLEHADFVRFGQMHRNTFIISPALLQPTLQSNYRNNIFFAGQITGVEGYVGSIATGLLAGINAARFLTNQPLLVFPQETMLGALCHYISHAEVKNFQPMKANFGIFPLLPDGLRTKRQRAVEYSQRSFQILEDFLDHNVIS